jgi:hypothetical protein
LPRFLALVVTPFSEARVNHKIQYGGYCVL